MPSTNQEGTGTLGTKWLRTDYPEQDSESPVLEELGL